MSASAPMPAAALELNDITVTFRSREERDQRYTAVAGTTLHVGAGEFVSVVGPTGCGKSTLLNIGAGLLEPSTGEVTAAIEAEFPGSASMARSTPASEDATSTTLRGSQTLPSHATVTLMDACAS